MKNGVVVKCNEDLVVLKCDDNCNPVKMQGVVV